MKKLEELGINPAPWVKYGDIVEDAEGNVIYNAYDDSDFPNANLIAAAPKLYEYLTEAVDMQCHDCQGGDCYNCQFRRWKDALAEAGGEVVC